MNHDEKIIEFEELLRDILEDADTIKTVRSYDETSLMTNDRGFVVTTEEGDEFQITIVQSR